jgi:hypothetical protein
MKLFRVVAAATLLCAPAAFSHGVARADAAFKPSDVFMLPDRRTIDDRCTEAKRFAELAANPAASVSAQAAAAGERAFSECAKLPRIDIAQRRYLILAAATATFMAAGEADASASAQLYRFADKLAAQLVAAPAAGSGSAEGGDSEAESEGGERGDMGGADRTGKFEELATKLRSAVAAALAGRRDTSDKSQQHATAAPSGTPAATPTAKH